MNRNARTRWGFMAAVVALIGLAAWAAPIVPERRELAAQTQSLAQLKRLNLVVRELPPEMRDAGMTAERIEEIWRPRLTDAGFELTDDENAPMLELRTIVILESTVPDAIAINPYMLLHQNVKLNRTGADLTLPTYARVMVGMEKKQNIVEPTEAALRELLETFLREFQAANKTAEQE